jgi:hypothetical protein
MEKAAVVWYCWSITEACMSTKRMVGSVDSLFGMLRRSGTPPRSVEEIDEMIARVVMADDERIRRGEKAG